MTPHCLPYLVHFGLSETGNRMQTLLINDKGTVAV